MRGKAIAIVILVLAGSGVRAGRGSPGKAHAHRSRRYEVKRGEFLDSLQFRGEVKALKSVTISAPAEAGDLQIIKVSAEGTAVKPGDVVVEFDKTKTEQDLAQYRSSSEIGGGRNRPGPRAGAPGRRRRQDHGLKARYAVESAKLEASKQEIVSKIEGEEAKLKLADAEQALREAETKQKSDQALNKATIESTEQASKKAKFDVQRAERALAQMSVARALGRDHQPSAALDRLRSSSVPAGRSSVAGRGDREIARRHDAANFRARR